MPPGSIADPRSPSSPSRPIVTRLPFDGIAPYTALKLISKIGTDMHRWPTEDHFTSWLTLAPKNKITGGRLISSRTQPSANRAAAILRMAAMSLGRTRLLRSATVVPEMNCLPVPDRPMRAAAR
ncbi:MAG: transposase, partial [Acidobacteria bacterium]|nr:transposase [Acidobacteriota bacterium]